MFIYIVDYNMTAIVDIPLCALHIGIVKIMYGLS